VCGNDEQVAAHQAEMLVRALRKGRAAGRLFTLRLWLAIRRRHPRTGWRDSPRFAIVWLFGARPFELARALRRRRALRWKARSAAARNAGTRDTVK
jgi:hypothetical protein